jgi:hypothetical protein
MVKQSAQVLSGIIDEAWGEHYFTTKRELSTQADVSLVSLPENFMAMLRLAWQRSASEPLCELTEASVDDWEPYPSTWGSVQPKYRFVGNALELFPTPDQAYTLVLYYSTGIFIAATTDIVPVRFGWDEWLVLDVCVKAQTQLNKEIGSYAAQRERIEGLIKRQCTRRDRSRPAQVRDVRSADSTNQNRLWWPYR